MKRSVAALVALSALVVGQDFAPARGAPDEESPLGYIEMPVSEDGTWVLTHPPGSGHNWGTPVFVRHLIMVAEEWKRRHPEGPFLRIGDMSKPDGSNFPPHKTHKDGLTADIFTSPRNICHINFDDQDLTLELAQLFYDYGARQILYNGQKVVDSVSVAQKWPQHDDHFHVVIDPARVPAEGTVLVLPQPASRDGTMVSGTRLKDDRTGLELSWRILGQARLKGWRVLFDDARDDDGVLHDSGLQKSARTSYELPVALETGKAYRWRVELDTGEEGAAPIGFGWQRLTTDLVAPTVEALSPRDEALTGAPTLAWRYEKRGVAQATFRIELDNDSNHRKISGTLGPFDGAAQQFAVRGVPFKRNRRYYWRVVVTDQNGNEAASEWQVFRFDPDAAGSAGSSSSSGSGGSKEDPSSGDARAGTVDADGLNMRSGPGTDHGIIMTLRRGTALTILGEPNADWLHVETAGPNGQAVRGYVSKRYVALADD